MNKIEKMLPEAIEKAMNALTDKLAEEANTVKRMRGMYDFLGE